ncbi:MAG: division/cell wall cluster transcriptional repressor MraZ [Bacteroidetes bacterium]|nr:division/cell wall cluster transcriptional repressor MraZ [Bacteroidota bacterium]
MVHFIGEYNCTMDTKGRIMLPKALVTQLPDDSKQQLVVNCGFEKCLVLYTKDEWNRITTELNKLNSFIKENRDFLRLFNRGANILTTDASGRVLIPKNLQEYGGLKSDVVFVTNSSKIELWDKTSYEAEISKNPEQYSELAERVMKGIIL